MVLLPDGSVSRLERDGMDVRRSRDDRALRFPVQDGRRRDAAGLAHALGDGMNRRAAVPDFVDYEHPLAPQQGVGRELQERGSRAGLPRSS